MEITIKKEEKVKNAYDVTIGNKFFITTISLPSESQLKEWVQEIQRIYGKRNRQDLVVGLCADRSINYANGSGLYKTKGSKKEEPYELLQLCVGNHCLLYDLCAYLGPPPKVLTDFLYNRHTIVAGVGIERIAKKLEEDSGLIISRRTELREEAKKGLPGSDFSKSSLDKLARAVLGEEVDFVKPKKIVWWDPSSRVSRFSDDMVKYATVEAVLAYEMASKLLRDSH